MPGDTRLETLRTHHHCPRCPRARGTALRHCIVGLALRALHDRSRVRQLIRCMSICCFSWLADPALKRPRRHKLVCGVHYLCHLVYHSNFSPTPTDAQRDTVFRCMVSCWVCITPWYTIVSTATFGDVISLASTEASTAHTDGLKDGVVSLAFMPYVLCALVTGMTARPI